MDQHRGDAPRRRCGPFSRDDGDSEGTGRRNMSKQFTDPDLSVVLRKARVRWGETKPAFSSATTLQTTMATIYLDSTGDRGRDSEYSELADHVWGVCACLCAWTVQLDLSHPEDAGPSLQRQHRPAQSRVHHGQWPVRPPDAVLTTFVGPRSHQDNQEGFPRSYRKIVCAPLHHRSSVWLISHTATLVLPSISTPTNVSSMKSYVTPHPK
jgi:hypothetical protein